MTVELWCPRFFLIVSRVSQRLLRLGFLVVFLMFHWSGFFPAQWWCNFDLDFFTSFTQPSSCCCKASRMCRCIFFINRHWLLAVKDNGIEPKCAKIALNNATASPLCHEIFASSASNVFHEFASRFYVQWQQFLLDFQRTKMTNNFLSRTEQPKGNCELRAQPNTPRIHFNVTIWLRTQFAVPFWLTPLRFFSSKRRWETFTVVLNRHMHTKTFTSALRRLVRL